MKKDHRKRVVSEVFVVIIGVISVVFAVLCHFGLLGGAIEIEIPRNDVAFQTKEIPSSLPIEPKSKEEFRKINLTNEEKLVFLDVSDSKVVRIWTIANGKAFFYVEEIKGYPLLTSIGDVGIRFLSPVNKMQITLYR